MNTGEPDTHSVAGTSLIEKELKKDIPFLDVP